MATINLSLQDYRLVLTNLITDDFRSCQLLERLSRTEFDVDRYRTNISASIFFLTNIIKLDANDELKDWYCRQIDQIADMDLPDEETLFKMASEILGHLVTWKGPEIKFITSL